LRLRHELNVDGEEVLLEPSDEAASELLGEIEEVIRGLRLDVGH